MCYCQYIANQRNESLNSLHYLFKFAKTHEHDHHHEGLSLNEFQVNSVPQKIDKWLPPPHHPHYMRTSSQIKDNNNKKKHNKYLSLWNTQKCFIVFVCGLDRQFHTRKWLFLIQNLLIARTWVMPNALQRARPKWKQKRINYYWNKLCLWFIETINEKTLFYYCKYRIIILCTLL